LTRFLYTIFIIVLVLLAVRVFPQENGEINDSTLLLQEIIENPELPIIEKPQKPAFESPIDYKARDSMAVSLENGNQIVYLYGDANIKYGTIELNAAFISVNLGTKEIYAEGYTDTTGLTIGRPKFKEGTEEFDCSTLRYNFETGKGFVQNVLTSMEDGKVHSEKAKMVSKDVFCIHDGKYSTCDADHPHFYLKITKGKIINNKAIIAGLSYIVIEDFPIYFPFLPYGYIPTNKKTYSSGILIPDYGELKDRGFFLKDGGFYWAASDYFDLKLTGEIYTKGSWGLSMENRYRKRYKYSGNFNFSYRNLVTGEKGINLRSDPSFSVRWNHSQDTKANPTSSFNANIDFKTSGFSKNHEYDNTEKYLQNNTSSGISYRKDFPNSPLSFSANMRISQNTRDSTISLTLPQLTFNMKTIYPFKNKNRVGKKKIHEEISFGYQARIENKIDAKEYEILSTPLSKWKNGVDHDIKTTLPSFKIFNHINFTPSISYKERWYIQSIEKKWAEGYYEIDNETGFNEWIPGQVLTETKDGFKRNYEFSGGIGASTTLYGIYQMKNTNAYISAVRHKMDFSTGFNYRPDFGEEYWGFWDWVQIDSLGTKQLYNLFQGAIFGSTGAGESGSVSFSMKNNIEMKVRNDKDTLSTERFKKVAIFDDLSFSGSYNLAADSMKLSVIGLVARTKIAGTVLSISGTLNPYALNEKGEITKEYMWNNSTGLSKLGRITNLSTGFNFNFGSDKLDKRINERMTKMETDTTSNLLDSLTENELETDKPNKEQDKQLYKSKIPWRITVNYNISYMNHKNNPTINQTLGFSGNIDITDKWKASFSSGIDLKELKLTHTSMSVTRSLHCWNMSFSFSPISKMPFYSFSLSANAAMLNFLKINKTDPRGGSSSYSGW
jgi:lipopolysaccharide assembly outer membrane protein LptD (OstA)